jgi:hypothetical protein
LGQQVKPSGLGIITPQNEKTPQIYEKQINDKILLAKNANKTCVIKQQNVKHCPKTANNT